MAFFKQCFSQNTQGRAKDRYPDDIIYPVHALDDTKTFRSLLLAWTICFNDVLDANKLRCSLAKLLEIGDWRKIGGRLRLKADGSLEIHAPNKFTPGRPAFSYSHTTCEMNIEDHDLAKSLPKADKNLSIWPDPQHFKAFAARPDAPATLKDILSPDTPQISLHITSFANATLVAILWPHTLMDIMGQQALLHAWSLVLAGRESEVPPVLGAHEDVLRTVLEESDKKPKEYILKSKQLQGLALVKFVARFAWDMVRGPAPETRTICLPPGGMTQLRLQASANLVATNGEKKDTFISDGDILTAWAIRAVAASLPHPRPMTALHAMNARFRIPSLVDSSGVYLQNMVLPACTFLSSDVTTGSLGAIALSNRQHLAKEATEAQVLASLREQHGTPDPSRLLYSDADALLVPFTNWAKARLLHTVDFGRAVVRSGDKQSIRCNPPGTPIYHHVLPMCPKRATKLMIVVLGKDYGENYWLTMTMSPKAWRYILESQPIGPPEKGAKY